MENQNKDEAACMGLSWNKLDVRKRRNHQKTNLRQKKTRKNNGKCIIRASKAVTVSA